MGKPIADSTIFRSMCFPSGGEKGYPNLALKLLAQNPNAFRKQRRGAGPLQHHSLAAYLSDLDRGEKDWWCDHPDATKELMKFLGLQDEAALGIHRNAPTAFSFSAFPALPPVDFAKREMPWSIGHAQLESGPDADRQTGPYAVRLTLEYWLAAGPRPFGDWSLDWLYVADELEFKLLLLRLGSVWRQKPLTWHSAADGVRRDQERLQDPSPLTIELSAPASAREVDQIVAYRAGVPLLVVARHPLPAPVMEGGDGHGDEDTDAAAREEERTRIMETFAKVRYWIWRLAPDWREQVIDWTVPRVKGATRLTATAVKSRLKKLDPGEAIFSQTGDVLELCHVTHLGSGIPLDLLGTDAASMDEIDRLLDLPAAQRERILRVLTERWSQFDLSWEWSVAEEQKQIVGVDGDLEQGTDAQKPVPPGASPNDLRDVLIAKLVFGVALREMITSRPIAQWAQGAFDAQRRMLIDSTLDQLSVIDLTGIASRIEIEIGADTEPALTLAAAEALFVAVGRQIAQRRICPDNAHLCRTSNALGSPWESVVCRVLEYLDHTDQRWPAWPWTRAIDTPAARLEWICACWAWSLTPAKRTVPATGLFPGWSGVPRKKEASEADLPLQRLRPAATLRWLVDCLVDNERQYTEQSGPVWRDFVSLLDLCLDAVKELPPGTPTPLTYSVAWLRPPDKGKIRDSTRHWWGIVGKRWPEHAVLAVVRSLTPRRRQEVAHEWWPKLVAHQRDDKQNAISRHGQRRWNYVPVGRSELLDWVAEAVCDAADRAVNDLAVQDRIFLAACPRGLPTQIKRALLTWLAARPVDDFPNLKAAAGALPSWLLFEHFGRDTAEDFPQFLSSSAGWEVARLLWLWEPERAVKLLQEDDPPELTGLANLLRTCPLDHLRAAIAVLHRLPQVLTGMERVTWVKRYLPHAGTAAIDLLKLAKQDAKLAIR